jgi:reactive chlorine resistance protein C
MSISQTRETKSSRSAISAAQWAPVISRAGRAVALAGVVLPLLLIGILKFTQIEIDALKPLIAGTPWLAWLYPALGEVGASYLLGVVEILAALLLAISPWSARAGVAGGFLGAGTFLTTSSLLIALPVWEAASGGFPWLNGLGSFLVKDIALLGIALVVLGQSLSAAAGGGAATR